MSISFRFSPLSEHLGVEIEGLDLSQGLSQDDAAALRTLLDENSILSFRGQSIDVTDQIRLIENFYPVFDELEDGSNYYYFDDGHALKDNADGMAPSVVPARNAHADFMWTPFPLPVISLYAVECEQGSGITRFHNSARAAGRLSADEREHLRRLTAVHSSVKLPWQATHPVLTEHPRTGVPLFWISQLFTQTVEGFTLEQSQELVRTAVDLLYDDSNSIDYQWSKGDLVVFDNLALIHGRGPMQEGVARVLRRVCGHDKTFPQMLPDPAVRDRYRQLSLRGIRRSARPVGAS
jgi:taurine dioxygenase